MFTTSNPSKEKPQKPPETPLVCFYCGDLAELMCSKCENAYYCKLQHQKLDWAKHCMVCKSKKEKRILHFQEQRMKKTQLFELISRYDISRSVNLVDNIVMSARRFLQMPQFSQDVQCQLQLGSLVCTHVRLVYAAKQFNTAENILSEYFKIKLAFLEDTTNIKSFQDIEDSPTQSNQQKQFQGRMTSGKLKLISTLANLAHDIYRNSIDMYVILVSNTQKAYGSDSLEVSNVYFYAANYLNSIKLPTKALACFLKCAKMRKEKGGTAYYNVGLLLVQAKRKKKALEYFQKALELLQKQQQSSKSSSIFPQIFQNIALIYMELGIVRLMMEYFDKALYFYKRYNMKERAQKIISLFILIRGQSKNEKSEDMKLIEFSKQKKQKKPNINLSSKNNQKYKNADKINEEDQTKLREWLVSFKQIKLQKNEPDLVKYPVKELQYLFGNDYSKNNEDQDPTYLINKNNNMNMNQGINVDYHYMKCLTSIEVGYLNELNRLLMECRERAAVYDILENSNFYQIIDQEKLKWFYQLNSWLVRPSDLNNRMLLLEKVEEEEEDFEFMQFQAKKPKTPKLDLRNINKFKDL